ncbi:transcriptional regulator, partial [Rhizobium leguminosarum]|nr:transcriptional regulator [Rhizobium ruizarguesonis]
MAYELSDLGRSLVMPLTLLADWVSSRA